MRDNRLVGVKGVLDTLHTMIDEHLTMTEEVEQHAEKAGADRADG